MIGTEIERKFLLRGRPSGLPATAQVLEIWQGWVPGTRIHERLRRILDPSGQASHYRTIKLGRGIERIEVEESVDPHLFDRMWPLTEGRRVRKRRHVVAEPGGLTWEIDEFLDIPLWLAEVELPTIDARVEIPAWLQTVVDREVTDESAYANINLAR